MSLAGDIEEMVIPVSFDTPDEVLGYNIRQIFTGSLHSSEGDPAAYVAVERV